MVASAVAAALFPLFVKLTQKPVSHFILTSYGSSWLDIGGQVWMVLSAFFLFFSAALILYSAVQIVLARLTSRLGGGRS